MRAALPSGLPPARTLAALLAAYVTIVVYALVKFSVPDVVATEQTTQPRRGEATPTAAPTTRAREVTRAVVTDDADGEPGVVLAPPPTPTARARETTGAVVTDDVDGEPSVVLAPPPLGAPPPPPNARRHMPLIGFGTAALGGETAEAVAQAHAAGYRHFDSAQAREWYREDLVGAGLAAAGARRERVWLTSKLHPRHLGYDATHANFESSLRELNTTYLDLFMLHYPRCFPGLPGCPPPAAAPAVYARDAYVGSWRALEDLVLAGRVRHIGISNASPDEVQHVLSDEVSPRVKPSVVQAHDDPLRPNRAVRALCKERGVHFVAYSSLGTQHRGGANPVLTSPKLIELAARRGVSVPEVVLAWQMRDGVGVIPRSRSRSHMDANRRSLQLELTDAEADVVDGMTLGM